MHRGAGGPSWIPFEDTWRNVGQKAATMRLNCAACYVSKVMAEDEAG